VGAARSGTVVDELGKGDGPGNAWVPELVFGSRAGEEVVPEACEPVFGNVGFGSMPIPTHILDV
jgi:hypothetical protein